MSLTTRGLGRSRAGRAGPGRQDGQILVVFAGGLVAFLAIAALVFDVGQNLLDWRSQRNAADAAALAGSRYIAAPARFVGSPDCLTSPSLTNPNCQDAVDAARNVARLNGYGDLNGDGIDDHGHVDIHIPPQPSQDSLYAQAGFIEVDIHTDRPSFFAAVLGMARQNVDASAIAGNTKDVVPPYSMLALNTDCDPNPSGQVGGNGNVTVQGSIVVNSSCDGALLVNGNGALTASECDVVGTTQTAGGHATLNCPVGPFEGAGDPLASIDPGAMPGTPAPVETLVGPATIPAGCPGSTSQITYIGSTIAIGNAAALTTDLLGVATWSQGDIAVVFAYRSGIDPSGNTPPDLPAGWTNVVSETGVDNNSRRIGYRILDGTETSAGIWTNATAVAAVVLRGEDATAGAAIGVHAATGSSGTTMTTPALSGIAVGGHSFVLAFGGAKSGASSTTLAGPGITQRSDPAVPQIALHTLQNAVSWSTQPYGGTVVGPSRTDAIEILANPNPSTAVNPAGCTLTGGGAGRYNIYRIHPGVYYGGIQLTGQRARVYMAPGMYWLAGGGLSITGGNNQLLSVNGPSSTELALPGQGVFIYDTEDSYYHDQCAATPPTAPGRACIGDISVNGNSTNATCPDPPQPSLASPYAPNPPTQPCQWIYLRAAASPIENLLIFVDRNLTADVFFNGDAKGKIELHGTIYDPNGDVSIKGGADDTVAAQIISNTFSITGNGGFTVTYNADEVVKLSGVGLVH